MTSTALIGLVSGLFLAGLSSPAAAEPSELPTAFGFNYGEVETTRIGALGGALRALGNGTSAMFLNPAAMAQSRVYHIEGLLDAAPETGRLMAGGVIVDSMMNRYKLAGGVSVLAGFLDPDGVDWSTLDVRVGLAYPFGDRVFVGMTGRYASVTQGSEVAASSSGDTSTLSLDSFTLDAGLTVKISEAFYVAVLGQNLASTHRSTFPATIGGGIGFGTKDFSLEADAIADLSSYEGSTTRLMAGGELLIADHFPIRLGYRFDQGPKLHAVSGGLGYVGTEFSIEASVRRTLSDPGATSIFFGLAYFLESAGFVRGATEGYQ